MPPLLAAYAAWPICPSYAAMLAVMTITPRSSSTGSLSSIATAARRMTLKVPTRLMSMVRWKSASGSGPLRPTTRPAVPMPAQFTVIRSSPIDRAASTAAWTEPSSRTSVGTNRTRSPSSSASAAPGDDSRSTMTTCAPSAASRRVVAPPRPDAPPVTSATVVSVIRKGSPQVFFSSWREMTSRWIWLVPSKIWVTLASRKYRSTGKSWV